MTDAFEPAGDPAAWPPFPAPLGCPAQSVEPTWIDYNGHMNMAYYHVAFDRAVDYAYDQLGLGADYVRDQQASLFTAEVHVCYLQELSLGERFTISWQLLDYDAKRLHFFEALHCEERLIATSEQMALHVSMSTRRTAPFSKAQLARLAHIHACHSALPRPTQQGRTLQIRRS
jgi:acyl-CoA thioester hydrolase